MLNAEGELVGSVFEDNVNLCKRTSSKNFGQ